MLKSYIRKKSMDNVNKILICRTEIQEMLGGISRTTFYYKRKEWEKEGTPFPAPDKNHQPIKGGGTLYRYREVMNFFKSKGYFDNCSM